jgi:DNA-directed RNA polymerase specialized sigma subunit
MKFGIKVYIKKRNLTSISRINGHENGIKLFRNLKNTVFDINHPNINQKYLKKHFLTQLDEIYRLVLDLTIFEEKNFGQFSW